MQLIKRLGKKVLPTTQPQAACTAATIDGGDSVEPFNCTANLTVTASSTTGGVEALLVNHPTGVMSMRSNPALLPPVSVTIVFTGRKIPATVAVRRVDATHANALPTYKAMGSPQYPNASEIATLKAASAIVAESLTPTAAAETSGGWSVTLAMPMYSVASLSF
jgi:hypothetical protein